MASEVADIVKQALELDTADRAKIIVQLLMTLDPPGEESADLHEWKVELDRREREMECGDVEPIDWSEARKSLLRSFDVLAVRACFVTAVAEGLADADAGRMHTHAAAVRRIKLHFGAKST